MVLENYKILLMAIRYTVMYEGVAKGFISVKITFIALEIFL